MSRQLRIEINFFQDFFGIIEEVVENGPNVGLPKSLKINPSYKETLLKYQKKINIPELLILNKSRLKDIMDKDYSVIEQIGEQYKVIWLKNKQKLTNAKEFIENLWKNKYYLVIPKIEKATGQKFTWNNLKVFIVFSYKTNATCDEYTQDIRLGISHLDEYTLHILTHELVHYHIRKITKALSSAQEEIAVRAIMANILDKDLITGEKLPDYWNYTLNEVGKGWVTKIKKEIMKDWGEAEVLLQKINIPESDLYQ